MPVNNLNYREITLKMFTVRFLKLSQSLDFSVNFAHGAVAQLVERFLVKPKVRGSNPALDIIFVVLMKISYHCFI